MSSWPLPHLTAHSTTYSPGSAGATTVYSFTPSFTGKSQPWSFSALIVKLCTEPSFAISVPFFPTILSFTTWPAFTLITGFFWPGTLNTLSPSARTSKDLGACAHASEPASRTAVNATVFTDFIVISLFIQVLVDCSSFLRREVGAHAHMLHDRSCATRIRGWNL